MASAHVRPGHGAEYRHLQRELLQTMRGFPGFLRGELFEPVEGLQEETVAVYSFMSRRDLDRWLTSAERRALLEQMAPLIDGDVTVSVVGGFAGIGAWRRLEASGGTASDYIRSRILRLARPSIALFAALALGILAMHLTGVDPVSIRLIGLGISAPLWFLAAYAFAQAYLPGLATFHARAPWWTLATLAAGALACDVLRFATGFEAMTLPAGSELRTTTPSYTTPVRA